LEENFMRKLLVLAIAIVAFAGIASAQIPTSGNIFVGYSYENSASSTLDQDLSRPNLNGWEASLEGKLIPHLGIVTDLSGHYGSQSFSTTEIAGSANAHELEVLFGPRLSISVGKFTPFAEVMFGAAHVNLGGSAVSSQFDTRSSLSNSNTSFASAYGGGIDYKILRIVALRVEADYVRTQFFSTSQNNLRLSTGIVLRF
jgi:opacity protein-like surface antigen